MSVFVVETGLPTACASCGVLHIPPVLTIQVSSRSRNGFSTWEPPEPPEGEDPPDIPPEERRAEHWASARENVGPYDDWSPWSGVSRHDILPAGSWSASPSGAGITLTEHRFRFMQAAQDDSLGATGVSAAAPRATQVLQVRLSAAEIDPAASPGSYPSVSIIDAGDYRVPLPGGLWNLTFTGGLASTSPAYVPGPGVQVETGASYGYTLTTPIVVNQSGATRTLAAGGGFNVNSVCNLVWFPNAGSSQADSATDLSSQVLPLTSPSSFQVDGRLNALGSLPACYMPGGRVYACMGIPSGGLEYSLNTTGLFAPGDGGGYAPPQAFGSRQALLLLDYGSAPLGDILSAGVESGVYGGGAIPTDPDQPQRAISYYVEKWPL